MRQGLFKSSILLQDGVFFGFCLGADYCAEHEHGIKDLKDDFGIKDTSDPIGVKAMQITKVNPDKFLFFTKGQTTYLLYTNQVMWAKDKEKFKADFHRRPVELSLYGDKQMTGAWSDRDFGIAVKGKQNAADLKTLWEAIQKKDVAFGFTSALPAFDNAGLCIFIVSKFPKVHNDSLIAQKIEANKLQAAADKTGLIDYLTKKGKGEYKGYYACRPSWNYFESMVGREVPETPDGLIWWLNPYNQQEDGYGYFSTQELKDWADGKEGNPISKHGYRYQVKK